MVAGTSLALDEAFPRVPRVWENRSLPSPEPFCLAYPHLFTSRNR